MPLTDRQKLAVAVTLTTKVYPFVGDALYVIPECQAHASRLCRVELSDAEADAVGDLVERLVTAAEDVVDAVEGLADESPAAPPPVVPVWITESQLRKVLGHLRADADEVRAALAHAGVGVQTDADARVRALEIKVAAQALADALDNADDVLECNCYGGCKGTCTKAWLATEGREAVELLKRLAATNRPEVPWTDNPEEE